MKRLPSVKHERRNERKSRTSLTIILAVFVFFVLLTAIGLAFLTVFLLIKFGVFSGSEEDIQLIPAVILMMSISLVIGFVIAYFSSRIPLKPINDLINKMNRLSQGDFKARLYFGSVLSSHPAFSEISVSFNKMAEELDNNEMLRNDFINNFSHEFKTPIVSINGFAKLIRSGNINDEQRALYLAAIEEESIRLSKMATNILELTKVENQTILKDTTTFNLSEQIRGVLLLCEEKWSNRDIELKLDFDEYNVEANEELLKLVWINLIDNAIKFTNDGGFIEVTIVKDLEHYNIAVSNTGKEIPQDKIEKIFNKFYQADESRATKGNGIGLAIVKRIVDLHDGDVSVICRNGVTSFIVNIPINLYR